MEELKEIWTEEQTLLKKSLIVEDSLDGKLVQEFEKERNILILRVYGNELIFPDLNLRLKKGQICIYR